MPGQAARTLPVVISIGVLIAGWIIAARLDLVPYLPYPWNVGTAVANDLSSFAEHILATARRAIIGFALGSVVGIAVALVMARSRLVAAMMAPWMAVVGSVPVLALIPIFILWFGLTETARIGFVATTSFFLILVAAAEAIKNVPQTYRWSAASLGATELSTYIHVVLPAILPNIFGGLRNAGTFSFALAVAAEFLGAQEGLGFYMIKASTTFEMDKMIAGVAVITALAVVIDQLIVAIGHRAFAWSERL